MTRRLSLRKPPLPPMGEIHQLRVAPGEGVAEPPLIGPRGAPAGHEAICVSSASDRETGAAGGAGDGAGGRFVGGARPPGCWGLKPPASVGFPGEGEETACGSCPGCASAEGGTCAGGSGGWGGRTG